MLCEKTHFKELLTTNIKCAEMELNLKNSLLRLFIFSSLRLFVPSLHEYIEPLLTKISEKDGNGESGRICAPRQKRGSKSGKERKLYAACMRVVPAWSGECAAECGDRQTASLSPSGGACTAGLITTACLCLHTRENLDRPLCPEQLDRV